jgi:hypothetical protein
MTVVIIIIIVCGVGVVLFALRGRMAPNYSVTSHDISEVIRQLNRSGQHGHFAVIMFVPPGSTDGEAVNLQYSIEKGTTGMDWVLIGPRNVADHEKVVQFASSLGYQLNEREENGVHYLRVTGSGIAELGAKIIENFYRISPGTKLDMITEGFAWQALEKSQI